ncbi:MAG: AAA family ATPase [bacterium]
MKKLPVGISDFKELITKNYIYVDKTEYIYNLVNNSKYVFLSRPRRFGKSLLLSTIRYLFQGEKELFKGLYIYDKWNWNEKYPVIRIDFGEVNISKLEELKSEIKATLEELAINHEYEYKQDYTYSRNLNLLIKHCYKKHNKQVVVLVDEYDKPILDMINKEEVKEVREILKSLYSTLKGLDEYLKFVLITGVSKFSKVSLFSGLNQLEDISLDKRYGNICGYTQNELEFYFKDYLVNINLEEIKEWYNGYNFLSDSLYNPFDVLLCLDKKELDNYWFKTGNPTFLINLIKKNKYYIPQLENIRMNSEEIDYFDIENLQIESLMFQSGYLTINKIIYTPSGKEFELVFPNKEVKVSLNYLILKELLLRDINKIKELKEKITYALIHEDINEIKNQIEILISNISYKILRYEETFVAAVFSYLYSIGFYIITEDNTSKGRIDLTIIVNKKIVYILEFKIIQNEKEKGKALNQIKQKEYYKKYLNYDKIYLIGIEFDKNTKNIANFEYEIIK